MNEIIQEYAKKWQMRPEMVHTILILIRNNGYGRTARHLKSLNIVISTRQLRYFNKKDLLHRRINYATKGKPANYRDLLRNI